MTQPSNSNIKGSTLEEQTRLRCDIYLVLASLFRGAPSDDALKFLATLETEQESSEMQSAWQALAVAAQNADSGALEDEYQELFIGVGRGEVVPFGSWHQMGSLMDKPLAYVRQDLDRLGFEREESVKEPEDHIAALSEVMAMLLPDSEQEAQAFFNKHIAPWFNDLNKQIREAKSADFYVNVAKLMTTFFEIERVRFSDKHASNLSLNTINVKNVTDSIK